MSKKERKLYSNKGLTPQQIEIRDLAMADLVAFVRLVAPQRMLGHCHEKMLNLMATVFTPLLVLWPRAHQKSTMLAYWVAWYVIKNPDTTVTYASATIDLAEKQLFMIKNILESPIVKKYWPELLYKDQGRRELWRNDAFSVDHWKRKEEVIRDPTVTAVGLGKNITGSHCDVLALDDIVVYDNSETESERRKAATWYSLANSILNTGGIIKVVGTRYHPKDLYQDMMDMKDEIYNDETGEVIDIIDTYTVSQEVVEVDGEFLWPRQRRKDGKWFGFNNSELAKKKSNYIIKEQFFAQYYNDPTDPEKVLVDQFEYYDRNLLKYTGDGWYLGSRKLNVYAAIDFASTVTKKADYTCIIVVGIDKDHNIFILDISRFKTDKISVMEKELTRLYQKWRWLKLRGEATSAQNLVVNQIKENNRAQGIFYSIESYKPSSDKETRINSTLEPRYSQGTIFHYKGGNCQLLEDEIVSTRPAHDDIKDVLASVIEIVVAPVKRRNKSRSSSSTEVEFNPMFGGVSFGNARVQ